MPRHTLDLNGSEWVLREEGDPSGRHWPASVPGNVQLDLMNAGKLPDPYFDCNIERFDGIEDRRWNYTRSFRVSEDWRGRRSVLRFKGVDYSASFFLNGEMIGFHEGMFGRIELDATDVLRWGEENTLEVRLDPAPKHAPPWTEPVESRMEARWAVKSQMSYGWDMALRLIPLGIWDDVELVSFDSARIDSFDISYELDPSTRTALLHPLARIEGDVLPGSELRIAVSFEGEVISHHAAPIGGPGEFLAEIPLSDICLWWPAGHGDQPLYRVEARLVCSDEELDSAARRIGFRTITLERNAVPPSDPFFDPRPLAGQNPWPFTLCVNGRRIFAKGSNLVPPDQLFGRIDREWCHRLLQLARNAHFNLLRIWGGGIVNKDCFYDLADEMGVLIWQEFPLSCNLHDGDERYHQVLEQEARSIVGRLRHHPSIALWCGGNELFCGWSGMCEQDLALRMLNSVCLELDPGRPFIPTSPVYGVLHGTYRYGLVESDFSDHPNPAHPGRSHYDIWNSARATAFVEFGCNGPANLEDFPRMLREDDLWPARDDGAWKVHKARHALWSREQWLCMRSIERHFGPMESLSDTVRAGQYIQCEAVRYAAESVRRKWPEAAMSATWVFNESCPLIANTSVLGWPAQPKPAYYYLARAYRPVHISARYDDAAHFPGETLATRIWWHNDTQDEVEARLTARFATPDGRCLEEVSADLTLAPSASGEAMEFAWPIPGDYLGTVLLDLTLECADGTSLRNTYAFGVIPPSDRPRIESAGTFAPLLRGTPSTSVQWTLSGRDLTITNTGPAYAVQVTAKPDDVVLWSDNAFFLAPGETRVLTASGDAPEEVSVRWWNEAGR